LLGTAAALGLLLLAAPLPAPALHTLSDPDAAATAPVVAVAALVAWALVAWLLLTAALTAGTCLRGRLGTGCTAVLRRTAPAAVRRAVAVALGVGVALGAAAPAGAAAPPRPAAASSPAPASSPGPAQALDWPAPAPDTQALDWPVAPVPGTAAAGPDRPAPTGVGASVVVRRGDSLWRLAADRLPADATDADVAAAWPAWWSANRAVLGDDPDLLHPGQRLVVPPPTGGPAGDAPAPR
jgi:nucleoid-associated protein YgaU